MVDWKDELTRYAAEFLAPPSLQTVSEWCEGNLVLPPPQTVAHGPYSIAACEYCREPLNDFADQRISVEVLCWGSQSFKTTTLMAGVSAFMIREPATCLWVMPTIDNCRAFVVERWKPMLHASPGVMASLPADKKKYFTNTSQFIGKSQLSWTGSNSAANLASRPIRLLVMDEVDKFPDETKGEASAVNLAIQRTKSFSNSKVLLTSTPTFMHAAIWQAFIEGDQRRYHVPCPHCGKFVVFGWAKHSTILPILGCEAWIEWDKEAKAGDAWDLQRVKRSARAVCPFCAGHITDAHKTRIVRQGKWIATAKGVPGVVSRHLPSLYSPHAKTTFGELAVGFLTAKNSPAGLQGFINGELAEPWESQDTRPERIEIIVAQDAPPLEGSVPFMTVDCQLVSPLFWYVVRAWDRKGNSRLIAQGHCDEWEELLAIQIKHAVADNRVGVDSGHKAQDVYEHCLRHGKIVPHPNGIPMHVGWLPTKGREKEAQWRDKEKKAPKPFFMSSAALPHTKFRLPLLEFNSDVMLDILSKFRRGPESCGGFRWEAADGVANEDYWRHMDAKVKRMQAIGRIGKTVSVWAKRNDRWPDHLLDCEIMQLPMAMVHGCLPWAAMIGKQEVESESRKG
jgi:hypothetical protein